MCTKGIHIWVLIDALNWYLAGHLIDTSIDTQSTLDWHSFNISIDTRSAISRSLAECQWTNINFIDRHLMTCLQKLADSQLTVDRDVERVLTEYRWRCLSSLIEMSIKGIICGGHLTTDVFSTCHPNCIGATGFLLHNINKHFSSHD